MSSMENGPGENAGNLRIFRPGDRDGSVNGVNGQGDNSKTAVTPEFRRVHPSTVQSVENDIKNREGPTYREFLEKLIADIRIRGVQVPLICYRGACGRIFTIDGETRLRSAKVAGSDSIPVLIYPEKPSDSDLEVGKLLANTMRLDMNALERAAAYINLMGRNAWSAAELSRRVHVSPGQIAKDLGISKNLDQRVQAMVVAGVLSTRAAYAISRLLNHDQQFELATKAVELPMAVESVEEAVVRILGTKKKAKPTKARTPKGLQAIIPALDFDSILAELGTLIEAVRRAQKFGLPLSAIQSLLRPSA